MSKNQIFIIIFIFGISSIAATQSLSDDFESNDSMNAWFGDLCDVQAPFPNPFKNDINSSAGVLKYSDLGGQYANAGLDLVNNFDLSNAYTFSVKIYVPSSALTGNQPNQISMKLQNGNQAQPWTSQTEIIKPIILNQWQTITFNFKNDPFINFTPGILPPTQRKDLNRVLLQINGENNNSKVVAYIDDFYYDGTIDPGPVYDKLVWSDEFNNNGSLDNTKWHHQTKLPGGGSWYNNEIQHYTNRLSNSYVQDGFLKIVAKKESFTDQGTTKQYTSARLNSKFAFTYGKVEIRAKFPRGAGTWPALWMLGKNINEDGGYWDNQGFGNTSWPTCGEIDIIEHWGNNQNFVQSAIHTPSSFGNTVNIGGRNIPTVSDEFHIYSCIWTADKLVFKVDNITHYVYSPEIKDIKNWPFDAEQYLLLNIAIQQGIDPIFSSGTMDVDYVRVFQASPVSTSDSAYDMKSTTFPNPVDDQLNISLVDPTMAEIKVKIYSLTGKMMKSENCLVRNKTIRIDNLDDFPVGMYLVTFDLNGAKQCLKMVKN